MRKIAIPFLIKRSDGYIAHVVESDGVVESARWVGPFRDADDLAFWLGLMHNEVIEILSPEDFGLPMELAVLRPLHLQVARCKQYLEQKRHQSAAAEQKNPNTQDQ